MWGGGLLGGDQFQRLAKSPRDSSRRTRGRPADGAVGDAGGHGTVEEGQGVPLLHPGPGRHPRLFPREGRTARRATGSSSRATSMPVPMPHFFGGGVETLRHLSHPEVTAGFEQVGGNRDRPDPAGEEVGGEVEGVRPARVGDGQPAVELRGQARGQGEGQGWRARPDMYISSPGSGPLAFTTARVLESLIPKRRPWSAANATSRRSMATASGYGKGEGVLPSPM